MFAVQAELLGQHADRRQHGPVLQPAARHKERTLATISAAFAPSMGVSTDTRSDGTILSYDKEIGS